jgi:hypothetical protein
MSERPRLATYYFPEYHPDARNDKWHGKGWTEWELVRRAEPKFPGHYQPKVPLWGYEDESDPKVMAKKIAAAADHGLDVFLFDWYWYEDGPFLQRCLDEGFLKAENVSRLKFAIMWANHDWANHHPGHRFGKAPLLAKGAVGRETFDEALDRVIGDYFTHPAYWRLGDGLYFSFYSSKSLIEGLGGLEQTRAALRDFREKTRAAGLGELHLNVIQQSTPIDTQEDATKKYNDDMVFLGFDSITAYIWHWKRLFRRFPKTEYADARENTVKVWDRYTAAYDLPYFPNVTMGWDNSPRAVQSDEWVYAGGVFTPVIVNNTPEEFEKSLLAARDFLAQSALKHKVLTINAFNEWTESSYLEPDMVNKLGYLEAIKRVFGGR